MDIVVHAPVKRPRELVQEVVEHHEDGPLVRTLGVRGANFHLPHLGLWDAFLPLMHITRNGGPLFDTDVVHADVHVDFPVPTPVADFFTRRAEQFGLSMTLHADTREMRFDRPTGGTVVLFGGGKDSRLLLATLDELGREPVVASAWGAEMAADVPGALTFEPHWFAMPNRWLPGLMLLPRHAYHGSAIAGVAPRTPWQQYYDVSAWDALAELATMFRSVGLDLSVHAPQAVLPTNLVQMILVRRHPDLAAGQWSTRPGAQTLKNLNVALAKRYHGIDHADHMDEELLTRMLGRFMREQLAEEDHDGHRGAARLGRLEMRAMVHRMHDDGRLAVEGFDVPDSWAADWIDHLHPYVDATADPALLALYREHADDFDLARADQLPAELQARLAITPDAPGIHGSTGPDHPTTPTGDVGRAQEGGPEPDDAGPVPAPTGRPSGVRRRRS